MLMIERYGERNGGKKMYNTQALKKLLGKFLDDIEKGVDPIDAGWIGESINEFQFFVKKGICEVRNGSVRVAFRLLDREVFKYLPKEDIWLAEVHQEVIKAKNMLNEVVQIVSDPNFQPAVAFLGWKRMLSTSGFPVLIDRILKAGFTIDKWVLMATQSSDVLSLEIVKRLCDENDVMNGLNKLSAANNCKFVDFAEKIKSVLKWDQVTPLFDKNLTLALGVLWFADSKIADFMYPESIIYVQKAIWQNVEKLAGEESQKIRDNLIHTIKNIEVATSETDKLGRSCPIARWAFIIRVPW